VILLALTTNFEDSKSEDRVSFKSGDFVKITGYDVDLVRLDLAFVHELTAGQKRLFLLVTEVVMLEGQDKVMNVPRMHLTQSWRVVGLPCMLGEKVYLVSRSQEQQQFKLEDTSFLARGKVSAQDDATGELLYCPWEISFI
jgi:hypothetical protein